MKMHNYIHSIWISLFLGLLCTTCKKEVRNTDAYTSFGRAYNISGNQNLIGSIKAPDEGYLLWGYTDAGMYGMQDGFLMRLDKDYHQLWYKTYGGFSNDYFESAIFDADGNIVAAGLSTSFAGSHDTKNVTVNACIYAVYVNGNGELLWEKSYQGNAGALNYSNTLSKVLLLPDQNIALVGSTNNYT